jgi:serine/threonine protein kinase
VLVGDRYELLEVIGTGGMATVWRARDTRLGRLVALKRPHPAPPGSDVFARFDREARMAAAAAHPNLVDIYDVGHDDDGPYLVMELIDSRSLADAPPRPETAARIGAELGNGLAALHALGIVHRDVKPANVLLAPGGAKLTDFGIARSVDTSELTLPGLTHGTPAYAGPEVLASGAHSPASDVYSLAALVFEIVAGVRYAPGELGRLTDPWRQVLGPALASSPEARPTAQALGAALRCLQESDQVGRAMAPTQPMTALLAPAAVASVRARRHDTAWTATAAFVGLLAVAALVVYLTTRGDAPAVLEPTADSTSPATLAVALATTAAPTVPVTTVAPSTVAPSTVPATTAPPTTAAPTTAAPTTVPTTTLPATPEETRDRLLALADASGGFGSGDGRGSPRNRLEEHLDEALDIAADGDDDEDDRADAIERRLRDAAELVDERVDGDTEAQMLDLIAHLADQLDVEAPRLDD